MVYLDNDSFHIIGIIIPRWGVGGRFSTNIGRLFSRSYLSGSVSLEINTCVPESRTAAIVSVKPAFSSWLSTFQSRFCLVPPRVPPRQV